jgi:hypothetical protein
MTGLRQVAPVSAAGFEQDEGDLPRRSGRHCVDTWCPFIARAARDPERLQGD